MKFYKQLLALLRGQSFVAKVGKFASGTVLSQLIPILLAPLLARMYAPEAFGTVAAISALVGFCSAISCLRYEAAICLPKYDRQAYALVQVSLWATLLFSGGLGLLYACTRERALWDKLANFDHAYLIVVGFLIVVGAVMRIYQMLAVQQERFFGAGIAAAYGAVATGVIQVFGGMLSATAPVLVLGRVIGAVVMAGALVITSRSFFKRVKRSSSVKKNLSSVRALARRYKDMPLHSATPALANSIASNFPLIIIGSFYGVTALGYFAMLQRLILMPGRFVGQSLRKIFLQTTAKQYAAGQSIHPQFVKVSLVLLALSGGFSLVVFVFSEWIFVTALGEQWALLGGYAKVLIIPFAIRFTASSLSNVFIVVRKTKLLAYWQYVFMTARIATLWLAGMNCDLMDFFVYMAIVDTVFYAIYFWLGWKVSKLTKTSLISP